MADNELSPQEQAMINALSQDEWISRSELARRLGKKRMTATDAVTLAVLIADDLVETQRVADNRPVGFAVKYRAKQGT